MKKLESKLQILEKYFSIDGNIATLKLVYDTFSELINPNFGDDKIEKLNDKLFSDILETVSLLPRKYKLNLHVVIKDFGDYTQSECENIIKQNIHLVAYKTLKERHKKLIRGWSLIGSGAAVLILSYFFSNQIWFDLINISGTLFVWEGANLTFIEKNLEDRANKILVRTINMITIEGIGN